MSLLPWQAAAPIFAPLVGQRVGLVHSPATGNAGDRMIEAATEQLLRRFGIEYRVQEPDAATDADVLVLFGGGNYGHPNCWLEAGRRAAALATGKPCVLLPQTAYGPEPGGYERAYVRDVTSLGFVPGAVLAPDLALCYEAPFPEVPDLGRGEFYSTDPEALWPGRGPDVRHEYTDPAAYLAFVARHREIVTDGLHVAICGLIAGRDVTLLPTGLHKQRSAWETWLRHFDCRWSDGPR